MMNIFPISASEDPVARKTAAQAGSNAESARLEAGEALARLTDLDSRMTTFQSNVETQIGARAALLWQGGQLGADATMTQHPVAGVRWNGSTMGLVPVPGADLSAQGGLRGIRPFMARAAHTAIATYGTHLSDTLQELRYVDATTSNYNLAYDGLEVFGIPTTCFASNRGTADVMIGEVPNVAGTYQFVWMLTHNVTLGTSTNITFPWRVFTHWGIDNYDTATDGRNNRAILTRATNAFANHVADLTNYPVRLTALKGVQLAEGGDEVTLLVAATVEVVSPITVDASAPAGMAGAVFYRPGGAGTAERPARIGQIYQGVPIFATDLSDFDLYGAIPLMNGMPDPNARTISRTTPLPLPVTLAVVAARPSGSAADSTLIEAVGGTATARVRHLHATDGVEVSAGAASVTVAGGQWPDDEAVVVALQLGDGAVTLLIDGRLAARVEAGTGTLSAVHVGGQGGQGEPYPGEIVAAWLDSSGASTYVQPALRLTQAQYDALVPVRGALYDVVPS